MNTTKTLVKYGLISGLIFALSYFISHFFFYSEGRLDSGSEALGYATMIIALSTVYFGIKNVRDRKHGGSITFLNAFKNGLVIVVVASVIYDVCWLIYYPNFLPDFADQYTAVQIVELQNAGLSAEELEMRINEIKEWMELYQNPFVMAGITFLEVFPVGLVVSAISAFILKKKRQD